MEDKGLWMGIAGASNSLSFGLSVRGLDLFYTYGSLACSSVPCEFGGCRYMCAHVPTSHRSLRLVRRSFSKDVLDLCPVSHCLTEQLQSVQ
jgi:hypothetical protein